MKDVLATVFGRKDLFPESDFRLSELFAALDRPEFLCNVPKVCDNVDLTVHLILC